MTFSSFSLAWRTTNVEEKKGQQPCCCCCWGKLTTRFTFTAPDWRRFLLSLSIFWRVLFYFLRIFPFSFFLTSARACQCTRNYKRKKKRVSAHSVSARIALPKWRFFSSLHPPTTPPPPSHFPVHERKLLILRKGFPVRTFFSLCWWSGIVHHFLGR